MKSELAAALAENTKALMEHRGWSQRELAKRSKVSQSGIGYVLRYEDASDRHAGLDTVERLAAAFGMSPLAFLQHSASPARNLHVREQRHAYEVQRSSGRGSHDIDVDLLQFIIEQVETLPGLDAGKRSALSAKAYAAFAGDEKKPTRAAVLKLVRSA